MAARDWKDDKRGRPPKENPRVKAPTISLPESIIEEMDRLAEKLGCPRSQVYEKALEHFLEALRIAGL